MVVPTNHLRQQSKFSQANIGSDDISHLTFHNVKTQKLRYGIAQAALLPVLAFCDGISYDYAERK